LKKISDKRRAQNSEYHKIVREFHLNHIDNPYNCLFCNKRLGNEFDLHHGSGERENSHLVDKRLLFPVHRQCHDDYHTKAFSKLAWYPDYIDRIKNVEEVYAVEKRKMQRSENHCI